MRTSLCDVLSIDVPVICAPFGPWDEVDLAAAVCEAGALASLGTAVRPLPELKLQWARLRDRAPGRPVAINHTSRPFDSDAFEATLTFKPAAISYHLGDPGELVERAHVAGILWIQQVMDVDQARRAVERGVDVIVAQGAEAGGHSGFVSTLVLVPQVVDVAGEIPVVAAGGIADGRGLAAALALGAQGVAMGTRLLVSTEMSISSEWKQMILSARAGDAVKAAYLQAILPRANRPDWPAEPRVLRTPFHDHWSAHAEALAAEAPTLAPKVLASILAGNGQEYLAFAGQTVGLVDEILPAAEIIRQTVADAERILAALVTSVRPETVASTPPTASA